MAGGTMRRLAEALRYSAIWYLEKAEYAELTDEEDRNVKTFWALEKSVVDIPPALKRDLLGLVRKYPDLLEQSLMVLLCSVNDKFRPTTAAEFVEKLNAQIQYVVENTKCPACGERMKAIEHEPGRWRFECQRCAVSAERAGVAAA
jgi:ribosomal protein S27AE